MAPCSHDSHACSTSSSYPLTSPSSSWRTLRCNRKVSSECNLFLGYGSTMFFCLLTNPFPNWNSRPCSHTANSWCSQPLRVCSTRTFWQPARHSPNYCSQQYSQTHDPRHTAPCANTRCELMRNTWCGVPLSTWQRCLSSSRNSHGGHARSWP